MTQKSFVLTCLLLSLGFCSAAQNGYIYIHNKSINESNTTNFTCNITGGSTSVPTFVLNDDSTYLTLGDIGASHNTATGTTGNGELWTISTGSRSINTSVASVTGTIYHRPAGSSQWTAITMPSGVSASAVDGAGPGACVFTSTGGDVYYYNSGTSVRILVANTSNVGAAQDVTYGFTSGKTAVLTYNSSSGNYRIYWFNAGTSGAGSYGTANTTSNVNWVYQSTATGLVSGTRLDFNYAGNKIAYILPSGTAQIHKFTPSTGGGSGLVNTTITYSGSTINGSTGTTISSNNPTDIAWGDDDILYCVGAVSVTNCSSTFNTNIIFRYDGTSFTEEGEGRGLARITGGAAGQMWGVNDYGFANTIWTRATDDIGSHVWIDDERVRTSVTNGNSIMIPVQAGTYTFTETLPSGDYDVGRFNIYDPSGNTTSATFTNSVTIDVSAGEVVNVEVINEYLIPKSIDLTCTTQILQTFGSGSNSFGPAVDGTAYHYVNTTSPQDGDYFLVHNLITSGAGANWHDVGDEISDHTGNSDGYFLVVNASYSKDEFFRQRVTNLVPGLQYTISFYVANALSCNPIKPNINYGLQDADGVVLDSASTGDITTGGTWTYESFTFTATTSTADLFLRNNNIGGLGNDLCLDDISLNPVITPLPNISVSPKIAPNVCIGTHYSFTNTQTGGIWTSSSSDVATINPKTGDAQGLTVGSAVITYTYTNQVGCVSIKNTGIIVSAPPSSISISSLNEGLVCNGQVDSLFSIAAGGSSLITYSWSGYPGSAEHGLSTADSTKQNARVTPTTSADTTYSYISLATDVVGCTISDTINIHVSAKTAPALAVSSTNACLGSPLSLTSSFSGGDISIPTYTWSTTGGATAGLGTINTQNTTATPVVAGTYFYKMKAFSGYCNVIKNTTATAYPLPSVTAGGPAGVQKLCGTSGDIGLTSTLTSSGTPPVVYAWSGSFVSGPTGSPNPGLQSPTNQASASAKPVVTSATSGNPDIYRYTVTVTDTYGCAANGSVDVTVYAGSALSAFSASASSSPSAPVTLCSGSSISLTSSYSGGNITGVKSFGWTGPGGFTSTDQNPAAIATSSGSYVVTITDGGALGSGCTASAATGLFTVNPSPVVTASSYAAGICNNTADTVYAIAGAGASPYFYAWSVSPGGASITNPASDSSEVTISTTGQSYEFTVTVTDGNGCTATDNTTIHAVDESGPSISGMASAASLCFGSTISLSPTVTPGNSTSNLTPANEDASSYQGSSNKPKKVDDGNTSTYWRSSNSDYQYVYLDFGSSVTVSSVTFYPVSGYRANLVGATIEISDNSNFPGGSTTTIYTFTSTPSNGYTTIPSSAFSQSAVPARYLRIHFSTHRGYLAELSATKGSTTPVNSYTWSADPSGGSGLGTNNTQSTTATPTDAGSYTYTLTATDNNDCAVSASTGTQTVYPAISVIALSSNPGFCGTSGNVQLFAVPGGGSGTYSGYAWTYTRNIGSGYSHFSSASDQNPTVSLSSVSIGDEFTYNVVVTDDVGCTANASTNTIVVANTPAVAATANLSNTACVGQGIVLNGHINTTTTAPYSYAWTPPSNSTVTPSSITGTLDTYISAAATTTASGNFAYGLLLVDANNCTATANTNPVIAINDTPKTTLALGTVPSPLCANPASTLNLTGDIGTGTTAPYTYVWSGPGAVNVNAISTTAQPAASGVFGLTVTDANGCTGTAYTPSVDVDQASPGISVAACGINGNGVAYVQLYESNGVSWLWTAGNAVSRFYSTSALDPATDATTTTSQSPFIKIKDLYTVNIVDADGCNGTGSIDATVALGGCMVLNTGILNFTAEKQSSVVLLRWSAPVDFNNSRFDIQRSGTGLNWQTLGTVKAKTGGTGSYNYNFTDNRPVNGTNFYRLRQVNINGHYSYSAVRKLNFTTFWAVKQYPNPASNYLILEFNYDKQEKAFITVQTITGAKVFSREKTLAKGFNRIKISQVKPLAQGTYILTLATGSNIYRSKFIKGGR